jgi:hypothetical protein
VYRFPVEAEMPDGKAYTRPPHTLLDDPRGSRKLLSILFPDRRDGGDRKRRGPAFAVLPTKDDPAAQYGTCYVVNSEHFAGGNPWTWAAWNDGPDGATEPQDTNPWNHAWDKDHFELLIAGPQGQVYHVKKEAGEHPTCEGPIDLSGEEELWAQLREGLVAGSVEYRRGRNVVPLVNVTALAPAPEAPSVKGGKP